MCYTLPESTKTALVKRQAFNSKPGLPYSILITMNALQLIIAHSIPVNDFRQHPTGADPIPFYRSFDSKGGAPLDLGIRLPSSLQIGPYTAHVLHIRT